MSNTFDEDMQTDIKFNNIDNIGKLKKIHDHNNITLDDIYPGDIISIFEETDEEKEFKPLIRCLVIEKGNDYVKGFECNIDKENFKDNVSSYYFYSPKYNRTKGTWINLNKFIQITNPNIKSILIRLDYLDLGFIEKRLQILNNSTPNFKYTFNTEPYIEVGDVISYDDTLFYVYKIAGSTIDVYRLIDENCDFIPDNFKRVHIGKRNYYINYFDEFHLKSNDSIIFIDLAYPNEIARIEHNVKKVKGNYETINDMDKKVAVSDDRYSEFISSTENYTKESKIEQRCGQMYKHKGKTAIYLFQQKKEIYVGIILEEYQKTHKIIDIQRLPIRKSLGILDIDKVYKIVEYLSNNTSKNSAFIKMFLSHLDKRFEEVEKSKKLLEQIKNNAINDCKKENITNISFGDIIRIDLKEIEKDNITENYYNHSTYFVSDVKDGFVYCFKAYISSNDLKTTLKSDLIFKNEIVENIDSTIILNFKDFHKIPIEYVLNKVYRFNDKKILSIKRNFLYIARKINKYKELCLTISNEFGFHKGDIIESNSKQKYLYLKEDENSIFLYQLYKKIAINRIEIKINNSKEFVEVEPLSFDKTEDFRIIYHISDQDMHKIENFNNNSTPQINIEYSKLNLDSLNAGDIITCYGDTNNIYIINDTKTYDLSLYYIIKKENDTFYCFKCSIDTHENILDSYSYYNFRTKYIDDNISFIIKFAYFVKLKKDDILGGIYTLDNSHIQNILKESNAYLARQNETNIIEELDIELPKVQKGDVIFKVSKEALNNDFNEGRKILPTELFYILETNDDHIYALRLKKSKNEDGFLFPCHIKNKRYFLNIDKIELTIKEKNDFSYFCTASEEENITIQKILNDPSECAYIYDDKI